MTGDTIPPSWRETVEPILATPEARRLGGWLRAEEADGQIIYPPQGMRLRALELTPLDKVRAVILGQDPYHGPGQAHGLAFSVPDDVPLPPSLRNIFKELRDDLNVDPPRSGNLDRWASQGVLLLNNALTVEAGQAGSHQARGWEPITDAIIAAVAASERPTAFILWGSHARRKVERIPDLGAENHHYIIHSPHPSPLSAHRGFFGSRPFSRTNTFLERHGRGVIDWAR